MEDQTTILIVDDEPAGREALEGVFFSQGYQLLFAENGAQAYHLAAENTPDLVLLDVMMPNMDGFEVCRRMRSNPLLREIPILIVTALDDRDSRLRGIEAGADDFITKPFDRVELRARVRTITRLNRYRRLLLEKARFAWVVEKASEGYLILDADGRIGYLNPTARRLLGLPQDETVEPAEPFYRMVETSFRCEPRICWEQWKDSSEYETLPVYLIQPETENSQPVWLELRSLHLPSQAGAGRLVRLCQVDEQISSLLGMWNFHSLLTHKLRTPVSNLTFGAEILLQHMGRLPAEEIVEILRGMLESGKRLDREISDILTFMHTPALSRGPNLVNVDDLHELIARAAGETGLQDVVVDTDAGISPCTSLTLSVMALEMIFTELFENAKKFHPRLSPLVQVSIRQTVPDMLNVTVQDDGVRLSPYHLAHMFTPYFQAEKYFTGEIDGMGLGLATVASLVWNARGECRLMNRADRDGIIVELSLPCAQANPVSPAQRVHAAPGD